MRPLSDEEAWVVRCNIGLVVHCVHELRICGKVSRYLDPVTYETLVSAGYLALCGAASSYDPAKGKWDSFACKWIKMTMRREFADLLKDRGKYTNFDDHDVMEAAVARCRGRHGTRATDPSEEAGEGTEKLLSGLKPRQRYIIERLVIHEDKLVDVAAVLGTCASNVLITKRKALLALRRKLDHEKRGLSC